MRRKSAFYRKAVTLFAMSLAIFGLSIVTASVSSAHVPSVQATCGQLSVNLGNYNGSHDNSVKVTVDQQVIENTTFRTSFTKSYALTKYESHSYVVKVTAWDDPYGRNGWTKTFTGNIAACQTVMTPPQVPVVDECGPGNAHYGDVPEGHYTVTRNEDGSITLTATGDYVFPNGQTTVTLPAPQDSNEACPVPPAPPSPPAPPTPTVGHPAATIMTSCTGRARAWLDNESAQSARFVVRAKKGHHVYRWVVTVKPGVARWFKLHGKKFPVGTKLTVRSGGQLLAHARVPGRCSVPTVPPNTGLRTGGKA